MNHISLTHYATPKAAAACRAVVEESRTERYDFFCAVASARVKWITIQQTHSSYFFFVAKAQTIFSFIASLTVCPLSWLIVSAKTI